MHMMDDSTITIAHLNAVVALVAAPLYAPHSLFLFLSLSLALSLNSSLRSRWLPRATSVQATQTAVPI
jgi:hypothetical protein